MDLLNLAYKKRRTLQRELQQGEPQQNVRRGARFASAMALLCLITVVCSGQSVSTFLEQALAATPADRQAMVSTFVTTRPSSPLFESDSVAVVYYVGAATSVGLAGDFNGWDPSSTQMTRLEGTTFWYRSLTFEPDARLDYKIVRNGSDWILDPRNPARVSGGFGPNSELAMPGYIQPDEIKAQPSVPKGAVQTTTFASAIMNSSRTLLVYTPPNYDAAANVPYPVILYHDGTDYVNLADVPTILDNLIAAGRIEPLVALFLKPINRETEYATTQTDLFTTMVVTELMPWARTNYRISSDPSRTAVTGASYGGLISTQQCHRNPTVFGLCAPFSPSYWVGNGALTSEIAASPSSGVKYYVDWGTYEGSIAATGPAFVTILKGKGNEVKYNVWHEGHSWGSWRAHQDEMLTYFFPGSNTTSRSDLALPSPSALAANYPNPFGPQTTIPFETSSAGLVTISVFDTLGRRVAKLVDETLPAGHHSVDFVATQLPSGVYLVQLAGNGAESVRTMHLMR